MKKNARLTGLIVFMAFICLFAPNLKAGNLPNGFAELRLAEGLDGTTVHYAPDGRLFVTQKIGLISIIKNGALIPTPFLDIMDDVDNTNERGLQNMVFDPNFANNGFIYVYYCANGQNHNRVSRFTATGDVADHNSELVILNLEPLASNIHNGGSMFFKDGKLFITTGEGSNGSLAQSFSSLLGKVLRINPDGSIPTDNPFYSALTGTYRMIYALGFRNPYRADIQPGTGRVFINDVGNSSFEEINELFPGKNYGWPSIEGTRTTQSPPSNYQDPLYAYPHSMGCCVGGGAFYNPTNANFPSSYTGKYFFGDYCGNYIKVLDPNTGQVVETFATNINRPISFTIGDDGSFYYLARGGLGGGSKDANTQSCCSEVWRVRFTNNGVPTVSAQPQPATVPIGGTATFVVGASGNAPLSIQWQRNNVNIPGATSYIYEIASATLADNGAQFRAVISNPLGSVITQSVLLKVDNNLAPVPTIILPVVGSTYIAGSTLTFSGSATDNEDGPLPPEALTWEIIFHHDTHTHPGMAPTSGISGGTFDLANREPASNVWYRVYLTATDSDGEQSTVYRDVFPVLSNVTLAASSPGLKLNLDGVELSSPITFTGVAGVIRDIAAPTTQVLNGITYQFVNWSDGGLPDHEIVTPTTIRTFSAYYLPLFLEAENATLSGAVMKFGSAGFSGLGYADFTNATGDYVEWTFNVPQTANYKLDFRYGNGTAKDRPLNLSVNGTIIETNKSFPPTGLWTDWGTASSTIMLNYGTNTVRLTANGANGGNIDYLLVSSTGVVTPSVSAPVFNPASGTYTSGQLVTITTPTSGASIYYTTDGTIPTTSSLSYMGTFTVSSTATINAIAVKSGMTNSPVSSVTYTINSNPNFSTMLEAEDATLSGALKKFAYAGFTGSGYGDYTNNSTDFIQWSVNVPAAAQYTLTFRYANGTSKDRPLQISVNGITTEASKSFPSTTLWTTWSEVSSTATLNAGTNTIRATCIGSSGGNIDHLTVSSVGAVTPTAASPVFTPVSGNYSTPLTISLSTSTPGATIYYTLDGTIPTAASPVYSSPITISASATIKALARASGYNDSPVVTSAYVVTAAPFSSILEAENATRVGVLVKYTYAGFSGTGYGDYVTDSGEYIEWVVNAPYTGSYILDFRYANGTTKDRPLDVTVNGAVVEAAKSFPSTGLWTTWGSVSSAVNLVAGNNTIRTTSIGKSGANIDNLKVSNNALLTTRSVTSEHEDLINIEDNELSKSVEVFPIPTREILTVKSKLKLQIIGLETMDGVPLKISYSRKTDYEWEVNLSGLNNGFYILNLQAGDHSVRKKIIVEK